MCTRIALVVLAALLALPIAQPASPVEAKKRSRTITRTFSNPAPMDLPMATVEGPRSASLYPSPIAVAGLKGKMRDVNLRLNHIGHEFPRDIQMLLVGPGGQTAIVMASVGKGIGFTDLTLTLDDEAAAPMPTDAGLQSGAVRPTNALGGIAFNAPAPGTGATTNASFAVFDGANPNGTWRLFVQDGVGLFSPGAVSGGWDLEITTKVKAKKKR